MDYYMNKNRYIDNCGVLRGVSDGVKKSKVRSLRPSERGQLAEVSLRRSEGQTLCLQLAAEKRLVRIPNRRKTMGALLLRLFWHVVAGVVRRGPMTLPQAAIAPPYQPDRPPRAFSRWCISVPRMHSYKDAARRLPPHLLHKLLRDLLERSAVTDRYTESEQISSNQKANTHITPYPGWDYRIKEAICSWPKVRHSPVV